jgi:hypothetical protein
MNHVGKYVGLINEKKYEIAASTLERINPKFAQRSILHGYLAFHNSPIYRAIHEQLGRYMKKYGRRVHDNTDVTAIPYFDWLKQVPSTLYLNLPNKHYQAIPTINKSLEWCSAVLYCNSRLPQYREIFVYTRRFI